MRRVLGTDEDAEAEHSDRESPGSGVVAAPMADEPRQHDGDEPDAADPDKVVPHDVCASTILRFYA